MESDETQLQLKPVTKTEEQLTEGSIALLKMEVDRLKEENLRLTNIIQDAEDMTDLYKEEKNKLGEKLLAAQKEIIDYKKLLENLPESKNDSSTISEMERKLKEVENLLSLNIGSLQENENTKDKLKDELMSSREKIKQVEAQLQLAEAVSILTEFRVNL